MPEPELLKDQETQKRTSSELPNSCYIIIKAVPTEEWAKLRNWNKDSHHVYVSACKPDEVVIVSQTAIDQLERANK